jgi:hypothetical protein
MDPRGWITTGAKIAKVAGVMIVLNAGRTACLFAALKVATTYRAESALTMETSSFAPSAKKISAKSVFRVRVLPAKTARRRCRKDFSPTKRTTMMCTT